MKKVVVLLIVLILVFSLVGCYSFTSDKLPSDISSNVEKAAETENQEEIKTNDNVTADNNDAGNKNANITETVIYDANDIVVTAKSISYDEWMGPELSVLIENNSSQNITVQTRNTSINGLMVDPFFSADVASGKKANEAITFMSSELELAGITAIQTIETQLHIFNTDSWDDVHNSDVIVITTDITEYSQKFDDAGIVAYDEGGIKIVAKKLNSSDSFWGADLYLYIENNSDANVTIQVRDCSIDGFMVDPIFSNEIVQGKKAFDSITFMESDLTDNEITDITSIELSFHLFDTDSWDTIKDTDPITITF